MKICTRTGDWGHPVDGRPAGAQEQPRVEACGAVDELNSQLGVAAACMHQKDEGELVALIQRLQEQLFCLGADLSTPPSATASRHIPRISPIHVQELEATIDRLETALPPLRTFILPGGDLAAAYLHLARTICRRAERQTVAALDAGEEISESVLSYLNRLSDLLFVLARTVNHRRGQEETPWVPRKGTEA